MNLKEHYKELFKTIFLENNDAPKSFTDEVITAIRKHAKDPHRTISSERGDNFDVFDHARAAANAIEHHLRNIDKAEPWEKERHQRRIQWLKSTIPETVVTDLLKKHFNA